MSLDILVKKRPMEMAKSNILSTSRPVDREHVPKEKTHHRNGSNTRNLDRSYFFKAAETFNHSKLDPFQPSMSLAVEPILAKVPQERQRRATTRTNTRTQELLLLQPQPVFSKT